TNNGGTATGAGSVLSTELPPPPTPLFTATPTSGVAPLTVSFSNATTGISSGYNWDFGDNTTSAATNPTKLYPNSGLYTVRLIASGPGGRSTNIQVNYITVANPIPPPPVAAFLADVTN